MKDAKITMLEQFNQLTEKRKQAKEKKVQRGPVDLKAMRQQIKAWDAKNRKP